MANRFWVGGTNNWNGTSTAVTGFWAASSGGASTVTAPGTGDRAFFDGHASATGTVTVTGSIDVQTLDLTGFLGTLTIGAFNVNLRGLVSVGSFGDTGGTHTLNMGSGTWTVTTVVNGGGLWNILNANLTLNGETSTLALTPYTGGLLASTNFGGSVNKAYNVVSLGAGHYSVSSGGTFTTLNLVPGTSMVILAGQSLAFGANPQTWAGTRAAPIVFMNTGIATATTVTMTCSTGTMSLDWGILGRIAASGGATFTATNSVSYGTPGWTIASGPSAGVPPTLGIGI